MSTDNKGRQIPIVCPGHTRPLAELQFCYVPEEQRTLLVSACHGEFVLFWFGLDAWLVGLLVPRNVCNLLISFQYFTQFSTIFYCTNFNGKFSGICFS